MRRDESRRGSKPAAGSIRAARCTARPARGARTSGPAGNDCRTRTGLSARIRAAGSDSDPSSREAPPFGLGMAKRPTLLYHDTPHALPCIIDETRQDTAEPRNALPERRGSQRRHAATLAIFDASARRARQTERRGSQHRHRPARQPDLCKTARVARTRTATRGRCLFNLNTPSWRRRVTGTSPRTRRRDFAGSESTLTDFELLDLARGWSDARSVPLRAEWRWSVPLNAR